MEEQVHNTQKEDQAPQSLSEKIFGIQKSIHQINETIERHLLQLAQLTEKTTEIQTLHANAIKAAADDAKQISAIKRRAEASLKQIEEDTRKANSESGFAFNAKGNAEEHAKAIAQIRGTVESTFSSLSSTKTQTDETIKLIVDSLAAAHADTKTIAGLKTTTTNLSAQVEAANERVTAVLPSIEQGNKDANSITAAKTTAEASAATIQQIQSQIAEIAAAATSDVKTISKYESESKQKLQTLDATQETALAANERVTQYEQELVALENSHRKMQEKLEGLLPHATSAGLASAFHKQKSRFSKPQPYWLGLFVTTIALLLIFAGTGIPAADSSWDAILRHFVNRLPIVAPLIWLALYAGHHYNMTLKMEEDYAYKEAVSTAFEGYKREMLEIPTNGREDITPLITLCENALKAIAERPGRIYDSKTEVVTPLTPAGSAIKGITSEVIKQLKTIKE